MTIVEQYTDMAGKIRMIVQLSNGATISLKFSVEPTTEELEKIESDYIAFHLYDSYTQIQVDLFEHRDLLIDVVTQIRTHPTLTLAQYNNYLSQKLWYEASVIRYFIFSLATALARHYDLQLDNLTETEVLLKVRNWICNQPINVVKKVIFGMLTVNI